MSAIIAVTGANGQLGNVVCRKLIEAGYRVKAMSHKEMKSIADLDLECVQGDILNPGDVNQLVEGCAAVIHCAGIISISGDPKGLVFKTNSEGPHNVFHAALKNRVKRIIHISSVHAVTEMPHSLPYDESRSYKTEKDAVYDYSKARGEQILLKESHKTDVEVVILRPSSIVGPFDFKPSLMGAALLDFYHQKIPYLPEGGYDFVDVRDVAQAAVNAISMGRDGEAYVLSGSYYTFSKLAKVIHKVTGKQVPQKVISFRWMKLLVPIVYLWSKLTRRSPALTHESIHILKQGHPHMDHTKAKKELHYSIRPLEESLHDFYQWQKENGKI